MAAIPPMSKNQLPGYQLISDQFQQGGFGKVYFAIELATGKQKAIKKSEVQDKQGSKYNIISIGVVMLEKTFVIGLYEYNIFQKWDCSFKQYLSQREMCSFLLYDTVAEYVAKGLCSIFYSGHNHCDVKLSNILIKYIDQDDIRAAICDLSLIRPISKEWPNTIDTIFFCLSMWKAQKRISYDFNQYRCTYLQVTEFVKKHGKCGGKYADLYWRILVQDLPEGNVCDMPSLYLQMMMCHTQEEKAFKEERSKQMQKARRKRYVAKAKSLKSSCIHCNYRYTRKNLPRHEIKCRLRKVPCLSCEQLFYQFQLKKHQKNCKDR